MRNSCTFSKFLPKMSFAHRPQLKWSSFLLLLLRIILELPSASSGKCEEHCDQHRLPRSTAAYILNCRQQYSSTSDISQCTMNCQHCVEAVCESRNPSIFYCPSIALDPFRCKQHCDDNRPSTTTGAYELDCSKKYSSRTEIEYCRSFSKNCPSEISIGRFPDLFVCPPQNGLSPPISKRCEERCNNSRPIRNFGAYTLSCLQEYGTIDELKYCRNDCQFCTRQICSPYNPDIFNCPALGKRTTPYPPSNGLATWIIILLWILGFLILVPCIGTCVYYCCLKRKRRARIENGTSNAVGYSMGGEQSFPVNSYAQGYPMGGQFMQQQQPYPMNTYEPSQQSSSSPSIASTVSTSKSVM